MNTFAFFSSCPSRILCLLAGSLLIGAGVVAQTPTGVTRGPVVLTLHKAGSDAVAFDRARLQALPQVTLRTVTPWTEGITEFRGPLVRDVLAAAGMSGMRISASAINDYVVEIPFSDFERYPVIIAITRDGRPMRVRDRGPLWVIYPWSDYAELRNERHHGRSIWQLKAITVE